jgi:predicted AAA+ superfamily ATPase
MIHRIAQSRLTELLKTFPAVALLGPRQVGKTTLAHAIAESQNRIAIYLDLELPSDLAKLKEPELYLQQHTDKLVIIDEIHRLPGIFQTLRALIDRRRRSGSKAGHFLILGSASMDLLQQSAETLAGRIAYLELSPLTAGEVASTERPASDVLWSRGGFPESFLATTDSESFQWRTQFIQTYLERDVPALGPRIAAQTLHRFWQMLAHSQGQLLNAAQLAQANGISGQTVARYLDIMVDLLLVRRLEPYLTNTKKRLTRSPKVYVRDSGLVHALLGIRDGEELLGHPISGWSWEGFVIQNILALQPPSVRASFYRSSAGAEIDLVLEWSAREIWAIEVKRSINNPAPARGFHTACQDIGATRKIVIYPGTESFMLAHNTQAVPLEKFLDQESKLF